MVVEGRGGRRVRADLRVCAGAAVTRIVGGPAAHPDNERPASGGAGWVVARVSVGGISMGAGQVPDVSDVGDVFADADRLLDAHEVAALLGISVRTWRSLVYKGYAPGPDDPDEGRPPTMRIRRWRLGTVQVFKENRPGRGRGPRGVNRAALVAQVRKATRGEAR